ncbi:hypothetical protein Acr_02g0001390 [Actinidia rufa]|uniref:Uncharacterized protein n=1 Tax=Actinidia rufa TaxID=165716 RepID=A0A7J0E7G7_9ERIC|nr:hypothetical protein Acr_02g0001390 [Actinidia rufa]
MARLLTPPFAPPVAYRSTGEPVDGVTEQRGSLSKSNRPSSVSNRASSGKFPSRSRTAIALSAIDCWEPRFRRDRGEFSRRDRASSDGLRERSADSRFSGRFAPLCKIPATKI